MYELFATAFVNDADFKVASSIISGYSWDTPKNRLYRVLYYHSKNPNNPKGITKTDNIQGMPPEPDILTLGLPNTEPPSAPGSRFIDPEWRELGSILKK